MKPYKRLFPVFGFIGGMMFTTLLFLSSDSKSLREAITELTQRIVTIKPESDLHFAGETVPINEDTYERLDRELTVNAYWQSTTLLHLKLSQKYFPVIESILKEEGVPDDFKYVAIAESGLRNPTSSASAKGYWQFMKPAAIEMGLEISEEVDERMHLEKSTKAACGYIKQLQKRFGTWTDALGAYNVGPGSYGRSMTEQKESNYYDLNINEETSRYVFRILAIKEVLTHPETYGFFVERADRYLPHTNFKEITVTETIESLADFAHEHGITYRMLKYYNPWLLKGKLTIAPGKSYVIKIPKS
ncbi:MAG: lytic transglycosylase domain-containing protein [Chitinophagales bacterium]|nr:lytic transglycosylase domain-containing protein [Chitinophagales bacterium]